MSVKFSACIAIFCLCFGLGVCQTEDSNKIASYFYQKCLNVTKNEKTFNKIYYETGEFMKELSHAFQNLPEKRRTFCQGNKSSLENHFSAIVSDLELCLIPQEKYLGNFVKTVFTQFMTFLCDNDGENVKEFFKASASSCRSALEYSGSDNVGTCFEKIFKPSGGYLAKKDICDDLNTAKKCFDVVLDEKCSSYLTYKNLNSNLFEYISTPCKGSTSFSSHFYTSWMILMATLLLSYITN